MRILVTGATGFIGQRLTQHLLRRGDTVLALGRRSCGVAGVENIHVAALDPVCIAQALQGRSFDAVMHLAAAGVHPGDRDDLALMNVNSIVPGAMVAIAAKAGARAVIIAGSSAEYRAIDATGPLSELTTLETRKLYGASKAAGGILALAQGATHDIPVAVVRLFNVFGPGEAAHRLLPSLLENLAAGRVVRLSAGSQIRDFVHLDDACAGLLMALDALLDRRLASDAYNLATGVGNSVADFARTTAHLAEADASLLAFGALPFRPDDLPLVVGDPSRLKQACGWTSRFDMEQGIAAAIQEYRTAGAAQGTPLP
jgi:nucleoside-diphosphate-sugar epimerase